MDRKIRISSMSGRLLWILGLTIIAVLTQPETVYSIPQSLNGSIQVIGTSSDVNNQNSSSVDQRYLINWNRRFSPVFTARAALTYDRFGTDLGEGGNIWQRQLQPSGRLQWTHPYFILSSTIMRREALTNNRITDIVQNSHGFNLATRSKRYPLIDLRYSSDAIYNDHDRSLRDTRVNMIRAEIRHTISNTSVRYNLTRRNHDNFSSYLNTVETSHNFRWTQANDFFERRLRVNTNYAFYHNRQTSRLIDVDTTVRHIDFIAALYAFDVSPDQGALDTVLALADGIIDEATTPIIDIGRGLGDQNLGIDFGFVRAVRGLYIYTDRPSGSALQWQLYTSEDNVTWSAVSVPVQTIYNAAFLRYEIFFDEVRTRYIKAVNQDINEVLSVLVTEIEALEEVTVDQEEKRTRTVHNINLGASYSINDNFQAAADAIFRNEKSGDFSDSRDQRYYTLTLTHKPSANITQNLQLLTGWSEYRRTQEKDKNTSTSYTLQARPMETLDLTFSAIMRENTLGDTKFQDSKNLSMMALAQLWPDLQLLITTGYSRNNQVTADRIYDTWTGRSEIKAKLTPTFEITLSGLYQTTKELEPGTISIRRTYLISVNYSITSNMLYRSTLTIGDDGNRQYLTQDYLLSWNFSPRLSASAVVVIFDSDSSVRSERLNARLSYNLSGISHVFIGYSGTRTKSEVTNSTSAIQLGLKTGF